MDRSDVFAVTSALASIGGPPSAPKSLATSRVPIDEIAARVSVLQDAGEETVSEAFSEGVTAPIDVGRELKPERDRERGRSLVWGGT